MDKYTERELGKLKHRLEEMDYANNEHEFTVDEDWIAIAEARQILEDMPKQIDLALRDIERWAGEAYTTPGHKDCPDGDEVYQALQRIRELINIKE